MKYSIKFIGFDEPLGIVDYFKNKITKVEKFDWTEDNIKVEIELNHKNNLFTTKLVLGIPHSNTVIVEADSEDINTSINLSIDKLKNQLIKIKSKRTDH